MSDPLIDNDDDASTPLTAEERADLILTYMAVRADLNEAEQLNIAKADRWAFARKRNLLDEAFLLQLHKRMFDGIWEWAGNIRTIERNIGVAPYQIRPDLRYLLDDVRYWIAEGVYPPDEIALRFHARLTWIHPFPNGNGRHARLAADLLIVSLGGDRFTWGRGNLISTGELRKRYIAALRAADNHDVGALLLFARS
jgi:Fic-DOC domain mobile mystery protein B